MERAPLFILNAVLLPQGLLPLRLFEPRYVDMVRDCFREQRGFALCLQDDLVEWGTWVEIVDFGHDDQGLLNIVCEGRYKVHVSDLTADASGLDWGRLQRLPDEQAGPVPTEFEDLVDLAERLLERISTSLKYPHMQLDNGQWVCGRLIELLPLKAELRQQLWRNDDLEFRLRSLTKIVEALSQESE